MIMVVKSQIYCYEILFLRWELLTNWNKGQEKFEPKYVNVHFIVYFLLSIFFLPSIQGQWNTVYIEGNINKLQAVKPNTFYVI